MSNEELYVELNKVFRELFMDDGITVTPQTSAKSIEHWDSFNHINLLLAIEMHFGITISANEVENLVNVGDLAAVIERKLS